MATRFSDVLWKYGAKPAAIAVCFVLVALLWTFPLQHVMAYPFIFLFFGAVIGSAWFGGLIAGIMAIALSYVLIAFLFIPPLYSVSIGQESRTYVAAYLVSGVICVVVSAARKRSEEAIKIARDDLETRVEERTVALQQSNHEILERERQLRAIAEAVPQQIWTANAKGRIEYANLELLAYVGKTSDALLGEDFFSIFHPQDARDFRESWEAARATIGNFEVRARIRSAANTYRWFLVRGIPQWAADGNVIRWYGVHIDIEDQQRAQQRLQLAHEDLSRASRTEGHVSNHGGDVNKEALLVELLLAGFFAIACFKARISNAHELKLRDLFFLTDRLERLRRTRWQLCSMVLLVVFIRLQMQTPIVAELTALAQFVLFLSLPTRKQVMEARVRA